MDLCVSHAWQISREFFVVGRASNWSLDDAELREMVHVCFATPVSTKSSLESACNDLIDQGRQSKSNRMSLCTRWSYLSVNPYAASGGISTLKLRHEDCMAGAHYVQDYKDAAELPHFQGVRSATLPSECPSRTDLKDNSSFVLLLPGSDTMWGTESLGCFIRFNHLHKSQLNYKITVALRGCCIVCGYLLT